jgi:hypothetical protein
VFDMTLSSFLPHCKGQPTANGTVIANAATTRRLRHHPSEAWRGAVVPRVHIIHAPVIVPVVIVVPIALTVVRPVTAAVARVAIIIVMMMRRG